MLYNQPKRTAALVLVLVLLITAFVWPAEAAKTYTGTVNKDRIFFRSRPSTAAGYIGRVNKGDKVEVSFVRDCSFATLDDVRGFRPVLTLLNAVPPGDALFDASGKEIPDSLVTERFLFLPLPGHHAAGEKISCRIGRRAD